MEKTREEITRDNYLWLLFWGKVIKEKGYVPNASELRELRTQFADTKGELAREHLKLQK